MQIIGFNSLGSIDAVIDGQRYSIPNDMANRHRQMVSAWEAQGNTIPAYVAPSVVKTKLYKADIWRRATDAEASTIDSMLSAQPVKLRRLWADASFLSTTDELFTLIQAAATQAFGSARAAQLLEPTE